MLLKNADVFMDGSFVPLDISVREDRISEIGKNISGDDEVIDCTGKMIWPGLFDIHTHGCIGFDFSKSSPAEIMKMCSFYAKHGVTSVLATTMTNEPLQYERAIKYIHEVMQMQKEINPANHAWIRGIHMEGPFLGKEKKGAHDEKYLRPISQKLMDEYQELCNNTICLIDIDPSLPGALAFINDNKDDLTISIAHTNSDYDTVKRAALAGAAHVTHLFNAMPPLLHREPGVAGAAFELGLNAEIICDGIHVHPAVVHLMFAAMAERMILISDSISPTGLKNGKYESGGLAVEVQDGRAYLSDGTLAGSTITLFDAVKRAVEFGIPLEQALYAATYIPAHAVGFDHEIGSIECGKAADLLIVNHDLNLEKVIMRGKIMK